MTEDILRKLLEHGVDPKDVIVGDPPNPFDDPDRRFIKRETVMEQPKEDLVNHPSHYTSGDAKCACGRTIECIDVVRHMNFNRGNVVKYVWRAGKKDDLLQELRKARWYLDDEIKKIEEQQEKEK